MSSAKRVYKYWSNKNLNKHVRKQHEEAKDKKNGPIPSEQLCEKEVVRSCTFLLFIQ